MPIVDARDLFEHAAAQHYRLPLVAPDGVDDACAWIAQAERAEAPLVLDISNHLPGRAPWEVASAAVEAAAGRSRVPVVLHRGGVAAEGDLAKAIQLGCGAITPAANAGEGVVATADKVGVAVLPASPAAGESVPTPPGVAGRPGDWEGTGMAAPALAACRRWRPVEHVVMFNAAGRSDDAVREMLRIGTDRLASVPGVRSVRTGHALGSGARYALCWLVLFANELVVAHYRDHPIHVAFADGHFRPIAADRMTIDFVIT